MKLPRYAKLYGTRFKGRLRYVSMKSIEPLAQFLFLALDKPQPIKKLTSSFGLTPRLIEDALADLIRRNAVALNVKDWTVARRTAPVPNEFQDRHLLQFWQDHLTGAVLPWRLAELYSRERSGAVVLPSSEARREASFMDMSNMDIVASLYKSDPETVGRDPEWRLDRVVEREMDASQPLFVPVKSVVVFKRDVIYIAAPELPPWITRSWSASCQRELGAPRQDTTLISIAQSQDRSARMDVVLGVRLSAYVDAWKQAVWDIIDAPEPPSLDDTTHRLYDPQNALVTRLMSACDGILAGTREGQPSHLADAFAAATRSITVCAWQLSEDTLGAIQDALDRIQPTVSSVAILQGSVLPKDTAKTTKVQARLSRVKQDLERKLGSRREIIVSAATGPGIAADFILVDGQEIYLADVATLCRQRAALRVRGDVVSVNVSALVLRAFAENETELPYGRHGDDSLHRRRAPELDARRDRGDSLLASIDAYRQRIANAISDGADAAPIPVATKISSTKAENGQPMASLAAPPLEIPPRRLRELAPDLESELNRLAELLREPLPADQISPVFVESNQHADVLVSALSVDHPGVDTISIFIAGRGGESLEQTTLDLLHNARDVLRKSVIVYLSANLVDAFAARLRSQRPRGGLRIRRMNERLPFNALVVGQVVVVGTHPWLLAPADESAPATFSFAFESGPIAAAVLDMGKTATDID